MTEHLFTTYPDLAARALGGGVVAANDELFAERENLIKAGPAIFSTETFGHKGKIYDGWETRRRREPGHDWATVRLGAAGIVRGVIIDTAWFTGNYPPEASVEATSVDGYPSPAELADAPWDALVGRSSLQGDSENAFVVSSDVRYTHVRLSIYPDGGVARFRVHGEVVTDPRFLTDTVDLVALQNGGVVVDCSNMFYSSPVNLILPGLARIMGDGWENARRRDEGNDFVEFRLAAPGVVRIAELDTSYFVGNAPGWVALAGRDARSTTPDAWLELLPRTRVQPDTPHRFLLSSSAEVTHVRLDVFPDGGLARVRLNGALTVGAREDLIRAWFNALPAHHATQVLVEAGMPSAEAEKLISGRPLADIAPLQSYPIAR
jgi:allantoicase